MYIFGIFIFISTVLAYYKFSKIIGYLGQINALQCVFFRLKDN